MHLYFAFSGRPLLLVLACCLCLGANPELALGQDQEPEWELGIGLGGLSMPDYVGSSHQQGYAFPIPYVVYNGDWLKIDRGGARGNLFQSPRWRLDVSANGGIPVRSRPDGIRSGMPDLDPTVEAGPLLRQLLSPSRNQQYVWSLRYAVRAVWSLKTDLSEATPQGYTFEPYVNFNAENIGLPDSSPDSWFNRWDFGIRAGPMFGSEGFHDYYYEVAPEYARPGRPAYDARAGFGGVRVGMAIAKRFPRIWAGLYIRYDYIGGAVFEDSPLVERRHGLLLWGGISWIFARSDNWVTVDDRF